MKSKKSLNARRLVKSMDLFAKPISLTYRGREAFKSTFGGVFTLLLLSLMVIVFLPKFKNMFNKIDYSINKNTQVST